MLGRTDLQQGMLGRHADPERKAVEAGAPVYIEPARAAGEESLVGPT
jgi:hypothetical protein